MRHIILALFVAVLAGCATTQPEIQGVTISPEERAACAAQGCTVWTDSELARQFFLRGMAQGKQRSI